MFAKEKKGSRHDKGRAIEPSHPAGYDEDSNHQVC